MLDTLEFLPEQGAPLRHRGRRDEHHGGCTSGVYLGPSKALFSLHACKKTRPGPDTVPAWSTGNSA